MLSRFRRISLKKKLHVLTYAVVIPLAALLVYSLISTREYYKQYDQIVKNITAANAYNITFKEELDYTMYRTIIGSANWSDSDEKLDMRDPYVIIKEARKVFAGLYDDATTEDKKRRLKRIIKTLNTLEDRVDDIVENVKEPGHYDENMRMLELNIYILTELTQEQIQNYIYYEAANMETLRQDISEGAADTTRVLLTVFVAVLMITWMLAEYITRSIAVPIEKLCESTQKVAKGDFSTRVVAGSGDELDELADSFNIMVGEISGLVEDVKTEQLNLRMMELKLLQTQINPHFLYNTLDTIIWLAEDCQTEQVVAMVTSLSDFFRTTLSKGKDYISIREEESHIRSYLEIQKFRYRDILEFEIDFSEEIRDYQIIKLTLQPIVENALYHGIKNKRGMGKITVTGRMAGENIEFIIKDNGIGMDEQTLERIRRVINGEEEFDSKGGFGMANVEKRIQLNYGKEYGMVLNSEYGFGTEIKISIPAVK